MTIPSQRLVLIIGLTAALAAAAADNPGSEVVRLPSAQSGESFDRILERTLVQSAERVRQGGQELNTLRDRLAREQTPVLERLRLAEERLLSAEQEALQLGTWQAQSQDTRRQLIKDAELLYKNLTYLNTLAQDGLKTVADGLAPGEAQAVSATLQTLEQRMADPAHTAGGKAAVDVADFMLTQVEHSLGGYAVAGEAMMAHDSSVRKGVFAFLGPETYFRAEDGAAGIVVSGRAGSPYPVTHALPGWPATSISAFFQGQPALLPADATAGKALRLSETKGSIWDHVRKGGTVSYAIVAVGFLALLLILQKLGDLARLAVDKPDTVQGFLRIVATGSPAEAGQGLPALKPTSRELFATGLENRHASQVVLEERLQATLLRQRLHFERRLPLLAVIATAAPLLGLLGTVTGMVQTFALITVFGTGNAAKLASGISEVLVATELGLLVAIPALVAHGFLSNSIQKRLALLERYALEFMTSTRPGPNAAAA